MFCRHFSGQSNKPEPYQEAKFNFKSAGRFRPCAFANPHCPLFGDRSVKPILSTMSILKFETQCKIIEPRVRDCMFKQEPLCNASSFMLLPGSFESLCFDAVFWLAVIEHQRTCGQDDGTLASCISTGLEAR